MNLQEMARYVHFKQKGMRFCIYRHKFCYGFRVEIIVQPNEHYKCQKNTTTKMEIFKT